MRREAGALFKSVPEKGAVDLDAMRFKTAYAQTAEGSPVDSARAAVRKISDDFAGFAPAFVVFFAAPEYDPATVAADMQAAFPGATTMGCSSMGEACDDKLLDAAVVAMGFSEEVFAVCETALILADADAAKKAALPNVFSDTDDALLYLTRNLNSQLIDLDYREYVGFMMGDATSPFTEGVVERVGEMTNVFLTGGIAADYYTFDKQYIFYNGKAHKGAAAIALWKPKKSFELLKTQAVELTDTRFLITKADDEKRIIWEFDGKPAAAVYSEAIGIPADKISNPEFDRHPLAMVANGDPYLRVGIAVVDGKGLQMYSKIRQGMRLTLTRACNFADTTGKALRKKIAETGEPEAILHIDCSCRYTAIKTAGEREEYGDVFARYPRIAYASFGEVYANLVGITSVMILFK